MSLPARHRSNQLACGNKRCPLCPVPFLGSIPDACVIKLPPDATPKITKVLRNRGAIGNIIPLDSDEGSSSWAIGSQNDRN